MGKSRRSKPTQVMHRWTARAPRQNAHAHEHTRGRPARVQLLVLIDRGWRELPIEARYIGRKIQTAANEIIEVKFHEIDQMEKVLLVEKVED